MKSDDVYVPNYIKRKITPIKMDGTGSPTTTNSPQVIDNNNHVDFNVQFDHDQVIDHVDVFEIPAAFETTKELGSQDDENDPMQADETSDEYLLMYKKQFLISGSKQKIEEDITSILLDGLNDSAVEKEDLTVFKKIDIGFGAYLKE